MYPTPSGPKRSAPSSSAEHAQRRPARRTELLHPVGALRGVLRDLRGDLQEVLPGPGGVVRHVDARRLEQIGVRQQHRGVDPGVDGEQPVVDHAGVQGIGVDAVGVEVRGGQIQQDLPARVLGEVALVHLDDVRCVPAGDLRGELVPVAAPVTRLGGDREVGLDVLIGLQGSAGELVARRVAPPREAEIPRLGIPGVAAARSVRAAGGQRGDGDERGQSEGRSKGGTTGGQADERAGGRHVISFDRRGAGRPDRRFRCGTLGTLQREVVGVHGSGPGRARVPIVTGV